MAEQKTPLEHWMSLFKAPFRYSPINNEILDANDRVVFMMDVNIQSLKKKTKLSTLDTLDVANAGGHFIASAMNQSYKDYQ